MTDAGEAIRHAGFANRFHGMKVAALSAAMLGLSCSNASPHEPADDFDIQPVDAVAFPEAVGFGASSRGGTGGRIIAVTSLADDGPGTYRACVEAEGPRVCVFRVDGVIRFTTRPPIIRNPYLTIAGQTASGVGITLSHSGGATGLTPLVVKGTHDVIVRHVRVRLDRPGGDRRAEDAITIENSRRVIIDHVSASGARDEIVNGFADNDEITVSNSIFSNGVPRHDKCALLASDPEGAQRLSFISNVCAHNGDRNPDMNFPPGSCVEIVNNIFYNAQSEFAEVWESEGGSPVAIVANNFIAGPDTRRASIGIENDRRGSTGPASIYEKNNRFIGSFVSMSAAAHQRLVDAPPCPLTISPLTPVIAYERGLDSAGAFPRDAIDRQVVEEIRLRKGRIGFVARKLAASTGATAYADRDGDGMADDWEKAARADPSVADPWVTPAGGDISHFEAFLAFRERRMKP